MLRTRVVTALVLVPLALWLVWLAPTAVLPGAFSLVIALSGWEWGRLAGLEGAAVRGGYAAACTALSVGAWALVAAGVPVKALVWVALAWWLVPIVRLALFSGRGSVAADALSGAATLTSASIAVFAVHLRADDGALWLTLLLVLVWGADVGGYFAGRRWGGRRLAPTVSPGKTWAGVWGGISLGLLCAVVVYVLARLAGLGASVPGISGLIGLGVAAIAMSVVGDLFESMIKRLRGHKDSGHLLPGHGGILDRIDGLLAAAPVVGAAAMMLGGTHA
ncbi:phosphatidate cytidylyltransferase [Arhodomonas sp. AD133]|uniref:phosphatidate cytidylyltransferase n=1 Tax=Arhodomonas sp. AD133 TaxID=3415009 RepID=UPI003EBF7289